MAFFDEFREELEEEGDDEQADVHSVYVGIGCDDDFIVAQCFESFFDVECGLEEVEFFVFVDHLFG